MQRYPRHTEIDWGAYAPSNSDPDAWYGLPKDVQFCRKCLISNQRPNSAIEFKHSRASKKTTIRFDERGISDPWHVAQRKSLIDWKSRRQQLEDLLAQHRRQDGRYDVLVPGSGGKDSGYAAHILKHEFGMHPLTCTWAPHIYTDWGWANHRAWIQAGFDNYLFQPNGRVHRLLTRLAVENILHPFQPFILGQKQLAPKLAAAFGIPLVMYAESEAEYGNPKQDAESAQRTWDYFTATDRSGIFLGGTALEDLTGALGLTEADLDPYMPADPNLLAEHKVEVHYLGYYLRWHPQSCYYYAAQNLDFKAAPQRTPGTYTKYISIDDKTDDFHYYTTFIKFGIGRAIDDASQEIRSGDITFEEGLALVRQYDGEFPDRFAEEIYRYLSLSEREFPVASKMFEEPIMDHAYFSHLCDRFRSPHLWKFEKGEWTLRHKPWEEATHEPN
jgi:N-acetyl sugar amidotransferase